MTMEVLNLNQEGKMEVQDTETAESPTFENHCLSNSQTIVHIKQEPVDVEVFVPDVDINEPSRTDGNIDVKVEYHCGVCNIGFANDVEYNEHERLHLNVKQEQDTLNLNTILQEVNEHTDNKELHCDLCGFTCDTRDVMFQHVQDHIRSKVKQTRVTVKHCDNDNRTKSKPEQVIQNNVKYYNCDLCPSVYKTKQFLKKHLCSAHLNVSDNGEKVKLVKKIKGKCKLLCNFCTSVYSSVTCLINHLKTRHLIYFYTVNNKLVKPQTQPVKTSIFRCPLCVACYNSKSNLLRHLSNSHTTEIFQCNICDQKFKNIFTLELHDYRTHNKIPKHYPLLKCDNCDISFLTKYSKIMHNKQVHLKLRPHKCHYCEAKFKVKKHLQVHISTVHYKIKKYECKHCLKTFSQDGHLNLHIKSVHTKNRTLECDFCKKLYVQKAHLIYHIKLHHLNIRNHICNICNNSFVQLTDLRSHIASVHNKIRNHRCNLCNKKYLKPFELRRHMSTYHDHKEVTCNKCKMMCNSLFELANHKMDVHAKYHCTVCSAKFFTLLGYFSHVRSVHDSFVCKICNLYFKTSKECENHSKTHNNVYKCKECSCDFLHKKQLDVHIKLVHSPVNKTGSSATQTQPTRSEKQKQVKITKPKCEYKCNICTKVFTNKKVYSLHVKCHSQPFFCCNYCDKFYLYKYQLDQHLKHKHSDTLFEQHDKMQDYDFSTPLDNLEIKLEEDSNDCDINYS